MHRMFRNNRSALAKRRLAAFALCILVFAVFLFSVAFIAQEAGHTCTGADCPICAAVRQCESALKQLGSGAKTAAVAAAVLLLAAACPAFCARAQYRTLFEERIRLNL